MFIFKKRIKYRLALVGMGFVAMGTLFSFGILTDGGKDLYTGLAIGVMVLGFIFIAIGWLL